jgi:hypothetical protein
VLRCALAEPRCAPKAKKICLRQNTAWRMAPPGLRRAPVPVTVTKNRFFNEKSLFNRQKHLFEFIKNYATDTKHVYTLETLIIVSKALNTTQFEELSSFNPKTPFHHNHPKSSPNHQLIVNSHTQFIGRNIIMHNQQSKLQS